MGSATSSSNTLFSKNKKKALFLFFENRVLDEEVAEPIFA